MKKQIFYPLLLFALFLAACGGEPTPITQDILEQVNCQPGDLPRNQQYVEIEGRQPSLDMFVGGKPSLVSTNAYNDIASTRQSFHCTIFIFDDEPTAQFGFESACDELRPPFRYPNTFGDQACRGQENEGEIVLVVRDGTALLWVWADYNGVGLEDAVTRMLDRLNK